MEETINVRSIMRKFAREALGGSKTPHGVSNPVFRRAKDGSYQIAAFVYTYNAQERHDGLVKRPAHWMLLDPVSGKILNHLDCHTDDFCDIPLDTKCPLKAEDATVYSKEYANQTLAIFDLILRKLRITGKFDKELNDVYMYMMLRMVSVGFKECYRQLNQV